MSSNANARSIISDLLQNIRFSAWWDALDEDDREDIVVSISSSVKNNFPIATERMETLESEWFTLYSGEKFYPYAPHKSTIRIEDIASGVGKQSRFYGQTREFYSIAQHSIYVAAQLPPDLQMAGLLHDASEAYMGDVVRPVKIGLVEYKRLEYAVQGMINEHFGLDRHIPAAVKEVDNRMLVTEARDLLTTDRDWPYIAEPYPWHIPYTWSPGRSVDEFIEAYETLKQGGVLNYEGSYLYVTDRKSQLPQTT